MKRLMTVAFAAVLAGGVYAQCGDPCNTYDFKASLTKPVAKPFKVTSDCGGCDNYRTKATGALNGWLVMCDCDDATLVVVVDKEKTAYVTTEMGLLLLNQMGKPTTALPYGAEVETAFGFLLCDPNACWSEQAVEEVGALAFDPTEAAWAIAAAGFGKVKSQAKLELPDLIKTGFNWTLVSLAE